MATYYVMKRTTACSPIVGHFSDTKILALRDRVAITMHQNVSASTCLSHLKRGFKGTLRWKLYFLNICLGAGSKQYCRYTRSPLGITPLKEIWESPRAKENLTSVGFEPTTFGLDLPMLYRLSYESTTGAGWGTLGSESRLMLIYVWVPEVGNTADTPNPPLYSRVLRGSLTI